VRVKREKRKKEAQSLELKGEPKFYCARSRLKKKNGSFHLEWEKKKKKAFIANKGKGGRGREEVCPRKRRSALSIT